MAHENMMESISQKFCPTCGKQFTVLWPLQWSYRRGEGSNRKYFCSWSCIRLFDKGETKMGLTKVTDAQKAKAVEIAIEGGDPIKYLDEAGVTENAAGMWFTIKKKLKQTDPDTYDRLPAKYKPVQKKTASDAMKGMQDAVDKFFGECEKMGLKTETPEEPKICQPVVYEDMTVREVEGLFGRFRRSDIGGVTYIDFEPTDGCDTLSYTAEQWKKFKTENDKAALILGVEL